MIFFIQNTVNRTINIGYSKNPKKRLAGLQKETADPLVLLGSMPGGLEHKAGFHDKFAEHTLTGGWFKGDILPEVQKRLANPLPLKMNVIVTGDTDLYRCVRMKLDQAVTAALDEIHAKTPIGWVITGGERPFEDAARRWARQNNVETYWRPPNWKKFGKFAGFKAGPQLLRTQFDPKMLLAFVSEPMSQNTAGLIKKAKKQGIEVVVKQVEEPARQTPPVSEAAVVS